MTVGIIKPNPLAYIALLDGEPRTLAFLIPVIIAETNITWIIQFHE